eukprot:scaffold93649_cov69-Phaeocystis_antarctica.AAC.1
MQLPPVAAAATPWRCAAASGRAGSGDSGRPPAEHARRAERHRERAATVNGHQPAVVWREGVVNQPLTCCRERHAARNERPDGGGDRVAQELLAAAGARDRTRGARVGPRADDGRVTDSACPLVGHAAGGRRRGQVPVHVECHRANGAFSSALVLERLVVQRHGRAPGRLAPLGLRQLPPPHISTKPGCILLLEPRCPQPALRCRAEHDVRTALHHHARRRYWVASRAQSIDRSSTTRVALHD